MAEDFNDALAELRKKQGLNATPAPARAAAPQTVTQTAANTSNISRVIGECEHCGTGFKTGETKCSACGATLPSPDKISKKEAERREAERKAREKAQAEAGKARQERRSKNLKKALKIGLPCVAALIIAALAIIIPINVAKANAEKGLFYEAYDSGYAVVRAGDKFAATDLEIPATYKGKPVLKIEADVFASNATIKSVTIPASVVSIGDNAFNTLSALESVKFEEGSNPASLGVGIFAANAKLKEIVLPRSMRTLGEAMFAQTALRFVDVPNVVSIPSKAFNGCNQLKVVYIKKATTSIGSNAFSGCSSLEEFYYEGNATEWLTVNQSGAGIPSLPLQPFTDSMSADGSLYFIENSAPFADTVSVGATALLSGKELKIPAAANGKAVYLIIYGGFEGKQTLENVTIPDSVLYVEGNAFKYCSSLKTISFPAELYIAANAFQYCASLETIYIRCRPEDDKVFYDSTGNSALGSANEVHVY